MFKQLGFGLFGLFLSCGVATATTCSSYPNTLTNGTTADASQVMANFNCAALTSGTTLNATTLTGTTTLPGSGTITSSGSAGIGTSSPGDQLEIYRGSLGNDTGGMIITNTNSSGYGGRVAFSTNNGSGNALNSWVYGEGHGSASGLIGFTTTTTGGTPTIGMRLYNGNTIELSTGYNSCSGLTTNSSGVLQCTVSDERLKQNIAPLDAATMLGAISRLTPVSYYWRSGSKRGPDQQFGFIANQVQNIFPNLVTKTSPTDLTPDGTLTLNYDGLIAPTIVAIQQLDMRTASIPRLLEQVKDLRDANEKLVSEIRHLELEQLAMAERLNGQAAGQKKGIEVQAGRGNAPSLLRKRLSGSVSDPTGSLEIDGRGLDGVTNWKRQATEIAKPDSRITTLQREGGARMATN